MAPLAAVLVLDQPDSSATMFQRQLSHDRLMAMTGDSQETERQQVYRREAGVLGQLGAVLAGASLPQVQVRLPRHLAEQAVVAWERETDQEPVEPETNGQRVQRHRAAILSLIGLSITERGRWEDDGVVVDLDPVFIGVAVDAADDLSD